jgi:glycerophosphoryl diester phosphodiesterase
MTLRIAHRGVPYFAPENSLEGFEKALQFNPDYVEMDVRATRDGQLVVMHDASVKRTTDGRGKIAKMTLARLRGFRLANGEPVPTLTEALTLLQGRVKIKLDCKVHGFEQEVVAELRRTGTLRKSIVIAYGKKSLIAFKKASAKLRTEVGGVLSRHRRGSKIRLALRTGAELLSVRHTIISRKFAEQCAAKGLSVHAWTVNDPAVAEHLKEYGIAGLATDRIDII